MESPSPENLSADKKNLIEKLIGGRESATQLQILFKQPLEDHELVSAGDLVDRILISFTDVLQVLKRGESAEVCQNLTTTGVSSPCCHDRRSEDSAESSKIPVSKGRRGGYKRRKSFDTSTKFTSAPFEDGYSWRKYGQKVILNAKFPRSYFRCTHKNDQNCLATKQVQRTEGNQPMYRTTYMGHHTCKNILKAPQLILDSTPREPHLLTFESNVPSELGHPFLPFPSIKHESKEEASSDLTHNHSSLEYLLSPDLSTFESSRPTTISSSNPQLDPKNVMSDVYSCTTSSLNMDMGMLVGSGDFDDMFHFNEEEFF